MNIEKRFRIWIERHQAFKYWGFVDDLFTSPPTGSGLTIQYCKENSQQFLGTFGEDNIEVWEGDLLSFGDDIYHSDGMPNILEVIYAEERGAFVVYDYLQLQGSALAEIWDFDSVPDFTVIGNIFANPELLNYRK